MNPQSASLAIRSQGQAARAVCFRAAAVLLASVLLPLAVAAAQQLETASPAGRHGQFGGMQRIGGEVTAVNGATITLKANDGTTWQIVTTDNTHILRRAPGAEGADGGAGARFGTPSKLADIHPGDGAMGLGMEDAPTHTLHAFAVVSTSAADLQALRANLGKTYITGRVVSVDLDNATMSLTRPDGVTQTIGFDENTSFRRGHGHREQGTAEGGDAAAAAPADESITLADIHPGDNVYGKGAVKNGMFIPAELTVMSPRRPRGGPAMRDLPPQQQ